MLKTVSSFVNVIGALNYKGTWNASTNSPALASGVGTKGDYYVVSVAGNTNLDGVTLWGVGDWAVFNGTAWQKVDGGDTGNFTTVNASGTITGSSLIPSGSSVPTNGVFLPTTNTVGFATNSGEKMRIDASGTLGLGVTPNAWGASWKMMQFPYGVSFGALSGNFALMRQNVFGDGANDLYIATAAASDYYQSSGIHIWRTAGSGTAGTSVSLTERMRITATGNVVAGGSVALATNATSGFLYVPTCAGTPTGAPTAITGMVPIVVDTSNNKLYFYSGAAWRDAGP